VVLQRGIEVDKTKIEVMECLPPPTCVKRVRSFLKHAGFYRCFVKDFLKITKPLPFLLAKDTPFVCFGECLEAFYKIKEALITALIIEPPNWSLPFEIICDASDYVVGTVLGQQRDKKPYVICHANKMFN